MKFNFEQDSYIALRNIISEGTSRILIWVGSGASSNAGIPRWNELKKVLLDVLFRKANDSLENEKNQLLYFHREISQMENNWIAFQRLKETIGESTYRDVIREHLRPVASIKIPDIYLNIWKLKISGLINLNIDRLATRARQMNTEKSITEFNGNRIKDFLHVLKSPHSFILNLHGDYDDYRSWVFTKTEFMNLKNDEAYTHFIKSCLLSYTIIFTGITVDDIAVGGHFEELSKISSDFGSHFWITDRRDLTTDSWAENLGIRLIKYDAPNNDHSILDTIISDLLNYLPKEEIAPHIEPQKEFSVKNETDDPNELIKYESDIIRKILNKKAQSILGKSTENKYKEYEEFVKKYDQAVHRAWYTSDESDNNVLLDYKLNKFTKRGAFGRIYDAIDNNGNRIAVKVLLEEERNHREFYQSFRRGVRSMKILTEHNILGIVKYLDAYEIPACVIMEWIDGPNLEEIVHSKMIKEWDLLLKIASHLAYIVEQAHRVPQRVLHRDLRPPNIMLKNFYNKTIDWEVVVLDFDLSWHIGASEKSVIASSSLSGYLAPEQIKKMSDVSTRHASVDSFGLGMTLYFMISGKDPYPTQNQHTDWLKTVSDFSNNFAKSTWKSLPNRVTRLVMNSTKFNQSERWDISQIKLELNRLLEVELDNSKVISAEMVAEEIMARTSFKSDYIWNSDHLAAYVELPSSTKLCLIGDESNQQIILKVNWTYQGGLIQKNIYKFLNKSHSKIEKLLKNCHWKIENCSKSGQSINIVANLKVSEAKKNLNLLANNMDEIINSLIMN